MAWQIKIHTLNVGQGDAQIIEVWDVVEDTDEDYIKWKKKNDEEMQEDSSDLKKKYAQKYVEWKKNTQQGMLEEPSSKHQAILIDGGPSSKFHEKLYPYLIENKIVLTKILLSHFDSDHYEGIINLIKVDNNGYFLNKVNEFLRVCNNSSSEDNYLAHALLLYCNIYHIDEISKLKLDDKQIEYIKLKIIDIEKTNKDEALGLAKKILKSKDINSEKDFYEKLNIKKIFNIKEILSLTTIDVENEKHVKELNLFWREIKKDGKYDTLVNSMQLWTAPILENVQILHTDKNSCIEDSFNNVKTIWESFVKYVEKGCAWDGNYPLLNILSTTRQRIIESTYFNLDESNNDKYYLGDEILWGERGSFNTNMELNKLEIKPRLFICAANMDFFKLKKDRSHSLQTHTNYSSVGLFFHYNNFTYLTAGDLEGSYEEKLAQYLSGKYSLNGINVGLDFNNINLMKLGHHGGENASSEITLTCLNPKEVILSCGDNYKFQHPRRAVIQRLYNNNQIKRIYYTNSAPRYGLKDSWGKVVNQKREKNLQLNNDIADLNAELDILKGQSEQKNKKKIDQKTKEIEKVEKKLDDLNKQTNLQYFTSEDFIIKYNNKKNWNKDLCDDFTYLQGVVKDYSYDFKTYFDLYISDETSRSVLNIKDDAIVTGSHAYQDKSEKIEVVPFTNHITYTTLVAITFNLEKKIVVIPNKSESESALKKRKQISSVKKLAENNSENLLNYSQQKLKINQNFIIQNFINLIPSNPFAELIENNSNISFIKKDTSWIWNLTDMLIGFDIISLNGTYIKQNENQYLSVYSATAKATIIFKDVNTNLLVDLELITSDLVPYWKVSLANQSGNSLENYSLSIKQLTSLADKDFMPYEIPSSLTDIFENVTEGLTLNRFDGIFYAKPDFSSQLNIDVSLNKEWIIIENKLSMKNIGFDLNLEPDSIAGGIYGTFTIANKDVEIYVGMDTESTWALSICGKTKEDGTNDPLPNLVEIGNHFITGFKNVTIPFIAEKDGSHNPKLELSLIQMKVNFEAKNTIRELAINSLITINELKFNILLHIYPEWKIKGYLDTSCRPTFGDVLNNFNLGKIESIKNIIITKASIEAIPASNFYQTNLALGNVSDFEIGGKKVDLVETALTIRSNDGSVSGAFAAKILIAESSNPKCGCNDLDYVEDTVFEIEAVYDENWYFKGVLSGHISLDLLTNWLKDTLGVNLPTWIHNLHLKNAAIAFSTAGDYSFDLDLYSNLNEGSEDDKQKLEITLHISKSAEKDEFELSATVNIGYEWFVAKIDKNSEKSKLLFEWQNKHSDSEITINEILADLGLKDTLQLPETIDIGFNEAAIEYETTEISKCLVISASKGLDYYFCLVATKLAGKWIYATKVGINPIKLHLNEIPLVGKEISEDVGVKNIVLLGLSDTLEKDSIEILNKLIEKAYHQLPAEKEGLQKGAYLSMQLDLGNGNIYPIQVSTDSNKPKQKVEKLLLLGDEPAIIEEKPSITWKKIAKKVGPLQFNKIGFGFQNSKLNLHFDTALIAGPLTLGLDDLELSSPITEFKPQAKLNGMSLQYISNALQIGGSFKKDGDESYSGAALIGNKAFQLAAIGAYAKVDDATKGTTETSLFVYAMLNKDLGGPSQFYIKGIATGFGYNRYLLLPKLDDVKEYPFVAPFVSTTKSDKTQLNEKTTVTDAIKLLSDYVSTKVGQQWFVAGIKFSMYNILDSVALLALKFGTKTEIGLVGFSEINYPKASDKPLIYAQLALVARILPDEGIAAVNAQLTAESYLFTNDCKLTGSFAFYMWFGNNANSGDFVVSLGGYHPSFNVPSHYPQVPRLGFNWPITSELNIKGEMYFALTPRCIMAGGRFEANYQSGNFRAWFIMGADFMIAWKPYHYEANMYVVFGVAYQFRLNLAFKTISKNISANFGAQLQIWGPDFSGTARIDLSVISFTIRFGNAQKNDTKTIDWNEFKTDFLPEDKKQDSLQANNNSVKETTIYCSSKAISGIIAGEQREIVQLGHENVVFEISTVIPIISIDILSNDTNWEKAIGIKPAGIASNKFSSELKIEITKEGDPKNLIENFIISEKLENIAGALWNDSGSDKNMVNNALMGLYIEPKPKEEIIAVQFNSSVKVSKPKPITIYKVEQTINLVEIDETIAGLFKEKGWIKY